MSETIHMNPEKSEINPVHTGAPVGLRGFIDVQREIRELKTTSDIYEPGSVLAEVRDSRLDYLIQRRNQITECVIPKFPKFKLNRNSNKNTDGFSAGGVNSSEESAKNRTPRVMRAARTIGPAVTSRVVAATNIRLKTAIEHISRPRRSRVAVGSLAVIGLLYAPVMLPDANMTENTKTVETEAIPQASPAVVSYAPETTPQPEAVLMPEYHVSVTPEAENPVSATMRIPAFCDEEITIIENDGTPEDRNKKLDTILVDHTPQQGCESGDQHAREIVKTEPKYVGREDNRGRISKTFEATNKPFAFSDGSDIGTTSEMLPIATHSEKATMFGAPGYSVIDGHRSTQSAPFTQIENFKLGDQVFVKRSDGVLLTYDYVSTVRFKVGDGLSLSDDQMIWQDTVIRNAIMDNNALNGSALVMSACGKFGSDNLRIRPVLVLKSAILPDGTPVSPTQIV